MDTSGDVDGDGTPGDPTIDFWFLGATGELGRDADKVTFVAADEPAAYVGIPGFQIDLDVETASIEAGQEVRLFVDETLTARANVTIEDGVGHVKFSTVTIPARGRPVGVHVEATVDGATVAADKDVELDVGPCVIEATLSEDALGCVDTGDEAIVPLPAAAARVQVTLTAGSCDRVSGTATIGEEVIALDEVAFAEDGTAELTVPLGTALFEGELSVEVTALHPSDDSRNGTATVTGRLDQVPADASWVTPPDALLFLSRSVDSDGDDTNGIQYQVQVIVDVPVDEAVTATLYRGDSQVGEVQATGPGTIDFGVIDFANDGVVALRAEVVDGCGNTAALDRDVQVVTGSGVSITAPVDGAVLLQKDDGDAATLTIYETTFSVFVDGATAGDTIEVLCQPALPVDPEVWTAVGSLSLTEELVAAGDTFEVAIAADIEDVGQASRCIARVPGDASDRTSNASAVTFAIPGPRIVVDNPIEGQCFTSSSIGFAGIANGLDGRNLSLSGTVPGPDDGPIAIETFATVATGAAAGDWSGTYTAGDLDGDYAFTLTGTDVLGNETSSSVSVSVDRLPPELALEAPGVAIDGAVDADQDLATPGYQTTVRVSVVEARGGGQVCLTTNGGEPACQDLADSVVWTGVTLVLGQNQLVVTGRDGCGNDAGTVSRVVTLVLDNPIAITGPAAGATLLAKNDGDKTTARIYETPFGVNAVRAVVGSKLAIECRPSAGGAFTIVGTTTVATVAVDGDYTVAVAVDTASLGTSVSCRATIDLPNAGTSPELALTFALPLPTLEITAPAIGACLTADFTIGGAATGLDGRAVTASLVATGGATVLSGSGNVTVGAWSVPVALGATVDGNYTVIADATDAFGNAVSDGVPPAVAVRVDRTLPTLARLAPGAEITDAADVSPSAGVQVDVSVQLQDQSAAGGEACLSVGSVSVGCRPVVSAATPVIFEGVTFQPGDNEVVLTGRDACGNAAGAVRATVALLVDTPTVAITTPAADLLTTATTLAFAVTVTEPDATPLPGVTVALLANGIDTGVVAIDVGDGTYTFANVPLAAGVATTFTARATRPGATGTSGPRIVTQKNVQPTIAVTQPANGTVFNRASAACQVGVDDCVLAVTATTTQAEDGSAAVLEVSCGAVGASYNGTVAGGSVSFAGVLLGNNQSCTLTPRVTDAVAQTVTGSVVTVSVDRTSPTVVITAPLVALQSNNDADPVATGVQAALTARLGGVPAGAIATATFSWTDAGGPQTKVVTHTVATATADGGSYTAAFEEVAGTGLVTWPEGLVTVVVSVGDTAGNTGSATQLVTVDTASSVRITSPASAQDVCGAGCAVGTVCNGGECWRAWGINSSRQVIALVSGLQTTSNNVRVCSDHPSLAATGAALCASAPSATGSYYQVLLGSSVSGSTILDIGAVLPEGYQRVVVEALPIAGGGWITSQSATAATERQRRLFVDLRAPVVASVTSPSDTLAPVGTLNAAEQFAVPRVFQVAFSVDEASSAQVFVNGTAVSTQSVAVGSTTVSVTLPEGTPQVWVVLTDSVGNRSPLSPGLGAVTYQPTVDVTLPTLTFVRPSQSPLKIGDNLDVTLSSSENGRTVTVFDGGIQVATGAVVSGSATFADAAFHLLTEGSHTLTASVSDAAGNTVSAATSPATVVVDLTPPTGRIDAPLQGEIFDGSADAAPGTPGFQASVSFATGAGAVSWSLWTAKGCSPLFTNCQPLVQKATGAVTNPGGNEPNQLVTLDIDELISNQLIVLQTVDAVGNVATVQVGVTVVVTSCTVAFANLPSNGWFNATRCATPPSCASASVQVNVNVIGICAANRLDLFDGATVIGTVPNPGSAESFTITVNNGVALNLEAVAYNGASEIGSTGVTPVGVDLVPPVVEFVATAIGGFTTPAGGSNVTWTQSQDRDVNTAGMQFHTVARVTDTNAAGGSLSAYTVTNGSGESALTPGNVAIPVALVGASPITTQLLSATLPDGANQVVRVTGVDAAGNSGSASFTATVDVTPPAEVPITGITVQVRRPRLLPIAWTAVGDNGNTGGAVAAYDIRYSSAPITEQTWDAACKGSDLFGSNQMPAPAAPGTAMSTFVGAPDTRPMTDPCKLEIAVDDGSPSTDIAMYWAIRARDAANNWSPLGALSTRGVTKGEMSLKLGRVRIDNTSGAFGTNAGGAPLDMSFLTLRGGIIGDINGDGRQDWAIGSSNVQGFCVFLGRVNPPLDETITAPSSATHTCLLSSQVTNLFPGVTQTGHQIEAMGDVNGDGIADFGVSGKISNGTGGAASEGYLAVYFGRANQLPDLTAPNLRIRGMRALTGGTFYVGVCSPGDFDGVTTNGRLTSDIAVGEPFAATLHVIPGQGTWDSSTNLTINIATAGVLAANGAWSVTATGGAASQFGVRCGTGGEVLATPTGLGSGAKSELLVVQSGTADSRVFIFPGREFAGGQAETVTDLTGAASAEDQRSLRLRQESDQIRGGFGTNFQGAIDLNSDGVNDILVSNGARSPENIQGGIAGDGKTIYIFSGAKLQALVGQDVRVVVAGQPVLESWTGTNGWVLRSSASNNNRGVRAIGDFNSFSTGNPSRPSIDLAIGVNSATASPDSIEIRTNHSRGSIVHGSFPVIDGEFFNWYHNSDNAIAVWIDGGADLTGDGLLDIITGGNQGEVLIVR